MPEGAKVIWVADNSNFSWSASGDGKSCTITPASDGVTSFTAYAVDKEGNVISEEDSQTMISKASFFWKIIGFIKEILGWTTHYPELFKFIF